MLRSPVTGSSQLPGATAAPELISSTASSQDVHCWLHLTLPAPVHGVAKSRTRLSDFTFTFHFHALEKEMATHSSVLAWSEGPECPCGLARKERATQTHGRSTSLSGREEVDLP